MKACVGLWLLWMSSVNSLPPFHRVTVSVPEKSQPFHVDRHLFVPQGFAVQVLARVNNARFLLSLPDGSALVSAPRDGKVVRLEWDRNEDGSSQLAEVTTFAENLRQPHGLCLSYDGNQQPWIYIAEDYRVIRLPFDPTVGAGGPLQVIVKDLPDHSTPGVLSFRHPLKSVIVQNDVIYVSIGSSTNEDPADQEAEPKRGAIYAYDMDGSNRRLFAKGVRNAEGIAFAPDTGVMWAVINQRDNVKYPFNNDTEKYGQVINSFVDNFPPEQFVPVTMGSDFGWPYCLPVVTNNKSLSYVADYDRNRDGNVYDCQTQVTPGGIGLEAHIAPLGFKFWIGDKVPSQFRNGALVGVHGSWNRQTMNGHQVLFFPWSNGQPDAPYPLISGWLTDPKKKQRWGRPVDVAALDDGSILISDDFSGTIYRLYEQTNTEA